MVGSRAIVEMLWQNIGTSFGHRMFTTETPREFTHFKMNSLKGISPGYLKTVLLL